MENKVTRIIQQYNDKLAKVYDHATQGEFKWKAPMTVAKTLLPRLNKNSKILDLGVGTGQSCEKFYKVDHKIVGVDLSDEMLNIAKKKFPKAKFFRFDIENNLEGIHFERNSFDAVIGVGIFEFIRDLKKLFGQIAKIIKQGGFFCFTFEEYIKEHKIQGKREAALGEGLVEKVPKLLSFEVYRRTLDEVENLLKDYGFKILLDKRFVGYLKTEKKIPVHYILILSRKFNDITLEN